MLSNAETKAYRNEGKLPEGDGTFILTFSLKTTTRQKMMKRSREIGRWFCFSYFHLTREFKINKKKSKKSNNELSHNSNEKDKRNESVHTNSSTMTKTFSIPRTIRKPLPPLSSWTETLSYDFSSSFSLSSDDDIEIVGDDKDCEQHQHWQLPDLAENYKHSTTIKGKDHYGPLLKNRRKSVIVFYIVLLIVLLSSITIYFTISKAKNKNNNDQFVGGSSAGQQSNDDDDESIQIMVIPTTVPTQSPTIKQDGSTIPVPNPTIAPTVSQPIDIPSPTTSPTTNSESTPLSPPPTYNPTANVIISSPSPSNPQEQPQVIEESPTSEGSLQEIIILQPNEYLEAGQFRSSPSGRYQVGLTDNGNLVLVEAPTTNDDSSNNSIIWSSGTVGTGVRCYMQSDGNMMLRDDTKSTIWSSETHGYPGAHFFLDDHGQIGVRVDNGNSAFPTTTVWMDGVPRKTFEGPSSDDLEFPIRGAFYYP
jgi:hypothetical protein